ncbi:MAG TPA: c-type cytochrome [Candidatus Angelobacter sp.]
MHKPWATLSLIVFIIVAAVLLVGYSRNEVQRANDIRAAIRATGGTPHRGKEKIRYYGCSSCHTIPGIQEANGKVGPPLEAFAFRIYIAGEVPNTPDNLQHWIMNPHSIEQHTAMPEMNVSDADSKDIAAYLYTLH